MAKYTQTIRRQIADELFECVWPFCEIGAQRVKRLNILLALRQHCACALNENTNVYFVAFNQY